MVRTEHSIVGQVYAAKTDPEAADTLIGQYIGFIRSETVKFTHAAPEDGHEDELSIAMLAFYESILSYEKSRGAFLPYAARAIRNRLIDHYRSEKRHRTVVSLHAPAGDDEDRPMLETLPDTRDAISDYAVRTASQQEIREFGEQLGRFGITFSDVADNCPKQERTLAPGAGVRPVPSGTAGPAGGIGPSAHPRAGGRLRCGQKDPGAPSEVSGGHSAGLYQWL